MCSEIWRDCTLHNDISISFILASQWEKPEGFQGQSESSAKDQTGVNIYFANYV